MRERSDAEAIRASMQDPEAFGEVFERHYDQIRRFAQLALGLDLGEDIATRTFMAAFEQRETYRETYPSANPWLFGICQNLIRREIRTVGFERGLSQPEEGPIDLTDDSAERVDASRMAPILREALSRLDDEERDLFLLRALADLSYEEISSALDIPIGTVRSRLHRAKRQLRELIEPQMAMEDGGPGTDIGPEGTLR